MHRWLGIVLMSAVLACAYQPIDRSALRDGGLIRIEYATPESVSVIAAGGLVKRYDALALQGTVTRFSADTIWLITSELVRPGKQLPHHLEPRSQVAAPLVSTAALLSDRSSQAKIERQVAQGLVLIALAAAAYIGLLYLYRER